jgi:Tfp pilus assembly protein PilF
MKLDAGMGNEALGDFEKVLTREPNRFHGTYGAARAAQLAGDHARAAEYYRRLMDLVGDGETQRAEVAIAKRYLASAR